MELIKFNFNFKIVISDENKSEDDASDHEVEEEKENFDQISQVEKEIRRKLMEIHSRQVLKT